MTQPSALDELEARCRVRPIGQTSELLVAEVPPQIMSMPMAAAPRPSYFQLKHSERPVTRRCVVWENSSPLP